MSSSPALSPYLAVKDAAAAMDFYQRALGATERFRLTGASGAVSHAEMAVNGAVFMLADEHPDFGALSPHTIGGSPIKLHLTVDDVDAAATRAEEAGATVLRAPKDEFYGERVAQIADPYGYTWFLARQIEDVSPDEMQRRWSEAMNGA
ncbi:MAG: VOC family protein [Pseudomonadota bacterium]